MPKLSPRDIRRKIQGIKNTRRITNAMKVVSAAKLRKAQELIYASRPYSEKLYEILASLTFRIDSNSHPLFEMREQRVCDLVLITADRGLAGAFNSSLIKRAEDFIREEEEKGIKVNLFLIGRKGVQYFTKRKYNVLKAYDEVFRKEINFSVVKEVGELTRERYIKKEVDCVMLLHNEMLTRVNYKPVMRVFLPPSLTCEETEGVKKEEAYSVYEFEVEREVLLDNLLNLYLNYQLYRAMLES
ncbi:MAG: F0F1 ATP synthase subunit gamma, partial [Aquificaceae bacterium]|nr:F0F1 ATP synthase subunit gamma [Aquificaceae bacterium]